MRLISQKGKVDVPYEKCVLEITGNQQDGLSVFATVNDDVLVIATYSTEEKALKVMEMVRNAYVGSSLTVFKDYSMEDTKKMMELLKKSNAVILESGNKQPEFHNCVGNTVFQFPKDEDVEV